MADILHVLFRSFMSRSDQTRALTASVTAPSSSTSSSSSSSSVLVLGDNSVSHSLLLLAAVTAASQLGIRVMFFTRTHIRRLPACVHKCVPSPSPESLKKIQFSYPRTVEELLQQIASLHESTSPCPAPPSLIIVDRLESFLCAPGVGSHSEFQSGEQSCAAHLSALLCDTAAFLTQVLEQRSSSAGPCRVIASFQSEGDAGQTGQESPVLDVLDRYFQVRCTLDQSGGHEAATATGRQQVWNIYLSGRGIKETTSTTDCEEKPGVTQEWQLLINPNGLMEFRAV
ncbi:hypothetical protein JOB18_023740 [Solea senegalensis]|uniref:SWIM-type zinc finger 7 associated protein 1 n=1 Tax=Solea senegalensis TaxID=28829 RepID=A0AAV6RIH8_SOLSE|nr:ATPase SWSAP1 [Solea senegalensis]KAG7505098.1 hypothetical protein JOB18_023740 [Solea senegalensis]